MSTGERHQDAFGNDSVEALPKGLRSSRCPNSGVGWEAANSGPIACLSHPVASTSGPGVTLMLWTIFAILLILWLLGWGFHVAGSLIHILLVIAIIVAIINLVTGRRTV